MSNLSGHGQLTGIMRSSGGSGGGSEVIINPSGAAIGTMEKISVDGDIYEVRNIPDATSASDGDVLTRSASGVGWYPPTKELPVYTSSDNNKVLTINNDTLEWKTISKELPNISSSDEGKVLKVSNGAPRWEDESGGGGSANYSTTEQEVGTWIDGRPLYEKTYYLPTQTGSHMAIDNSINMSNADVCFVTNFSYKFGNYINGVPMGYEIGLNSNEGVFLDFNHSISPFGSGLSEIYITIRYVKVGE